MPRFIEGHIIIGNSAAAIGAVEAIRRAGSKDRILLISDEPFTTYSRPLISELLSGEVSEERMGYRPGDFYETHDVETLLNTRIERVIPDKHHIVLADGQEIAYQTLLIATGSSPIVPPIAGIDLEGVFTFLRWQEADALKKSATTARRAVVVGAGLIGLKAAESLRHLGLDVTVVELAPRILPTAADAGAAAILLDHLCSHGLRVITGASVTSLEGDDGRVTSAVVSTGERLPCDCAVIAVGVWPNTGLVKDTSIEVRRGIVVDSHMRTTATDVYAAGDVAEGFDLISGENRLLPLWPVAYKQGAIAGANMAGVVTDYEGLFAMNSIQLFDLPLMSMGRLDPIEEPGYEVLLRNEADVYRKIILREGVIEGAVFVRSIDRVGIIAGLMKDRTNVTPFKQALLSDDFGLLSLPREWRKAKLAPTGLKKQ